MLQLPEQAPAVRTRLRATVDEPSRRLRASAELTYRHAGADSIAELVLGIAVTPVHIAVEGRDVAAIPGQPGELVLPLRPALRAGDSVTVTAAWEAPLDGADGRRIVLGGWHPRVLGPVSGTSRRLPLMGTILLHLDVAPDQVVAATGVPLCGDPRWGAARQPAGAPVTLARDWYRSPRDPLARAPRDCADSVGHTRRIVWYAEEVPELALVMSPDFRYEEGDFLEKPVRVLYRRGSERTWGAGLVQRRAETALAWVHELVGRYPWPQLTVVDGGAPPGETLPMLLLAERPSQAGLLQLMGLQVTQQLLPGSPASIASGVAAFQSIWFFETIGRRGDYARLEREVLDWDLDGLARRSEPTGPVAGSACPETGCVRTEFMVHQLRHWLLDDAALRALLQRYYRDHLLQPASPRAFPRLAAELVQPSPEPLFRQLPQGGVLYDAAIAHAWREPLGDSAWRTHVVVRREAPGLFPHTVWVLAGGDTAVARSAALAPVETLTVVTRAAPARVLLDPEARSHDWDMLDNQRRFGFHAGWLLLSPHQPLEYYLDPYFSQRQRRDRLTVGLAPTAWYNDAGGWTFGARLREDYLGRFERHEAWLSLSTGWGTDDGRVDVNGRLRLRNPTWFRATNWSQLLGAGWVEGRVMAEAGLERRFRTAVLDSTQRTLGASIRWFNVAQPEYLDPRFWDDAGVVEGALRGRLERPGSTWRLVLDAEAAAGHAAVENGPDGAYGRVAASAAMRGRLAPRVLAGARVFGGVALGGDAVTRQRLHYVAGADPWQRFESPFLRSDRSILAIPGVHYHAPGGAGVRGVDPRIAAPTLLGASVELEYALVRGPVRGLFGAITLALFADAALADGDVGGDALEPIADAGLGLRASHRLGQTHFQTRLDLPFWVSRPALAQEDQPSGALGFRWSFSFVPAF